MERIAVIENGEIVNVVKAASDWVDPQGRETIVAPPCSGFEIGAKRQADGSWVLPAADDLTIEEQQANRQAAFQLEADPLFFKWQAGEGTKEDWEAKRAEISARYPYPE